MSSVHTEKRVCLFSLMINKNITMKTKSHDKPLQYFTLKVHEVPLDSTMFLPKHFYSLVPLKWSFLQCVLSVVFLTVIMLTSSTVNH